MKKNRCEICGFDKGIAKHHIIKRRIGGTDSEENLVLLCPNHHWIADFGTDEERLEILKLIKKSTGKIGKEIEGKEKELLDNKIKVLVEEGLCIFNKEIKKSFSKEEWEKMKSTSNYSSTKSWLLGRGCTPVQSSLLNKRAEILILIYKLKLELQNTLF